jgi:hypothetical protein
MESAQNMAFSFNHEFEVNAIKHVISVDRVTDAPPTYRYTVERIDQWTGERSSVGSETRTYWANDLGHASSDVFALLKQELAQIKRGFCDRIRNARTE